jgi:acyl-[acyl-carrier-protein]-phospholipid O-acyltransferase/long-chain-fatty-acid--[acyl-carrier-protein] ligase
VELRGWEHYPHHEPRLLIVANHVSYLDGMLLAAFLPDLPVFVINTHMARQWWVKPFIAITRHISVDPTNSHYLKTLIQHIKAGERVAVFPEGRISVTGALMKIYEGPALAADKADAALLPVYIEGAQYSLLSRLGGIARRRLFPRIRLTMLPPRRLSAPPGNSRVRRQQLGRQLDELMVELAYAGMNIDQPLFLALLEARERHGGGRIVLEDAQQQAMARSLDCSRLADPRLHPRRTAGVGLRRMQRNVGLLLPNSRRRRRRPPGPALCAGRVPVLLNFTAGSHDLLGACRTAQVGTVCTSRPSWPPPIWNRTSPR